MKIYSLSCENCSRKHLSKLPQFWFLDFENYIFLQDDFKMGRAYNLRNTSARKPRKDPDSRKRQSRQSNNDRQKETNAKASETMDASSNSEEIRKKGNEAFKKFTYCANRPLQKGMKHISLHFVKRCSRHTFSRVPN